MKSHFTRCLVAAALITGTVNVANAENYPDPRQTLNIIVPFGSGGVSDAIARILAEKFKAVWGTSAVVQNKPGGEFMVGAAALANAKKDGYTMGIITMGLVQNQIIKPQQPVNPFKAFSPIGMIAKTPLVLVVSKNSPYKTFKELQQVSAKNPGSLQFSSCCTAMWFSIEMLKHNAGLAGQHIPYKGSAPSVTAVASGETAYTVDTPLATQPFLGKGGKLHALAVLSRQRLPSLPDVPDLGEVGVSGKWELNTWYALAFPANTPVAIIDKANAALNKILAMPDVQQQFAHFVIQPDPMTPAQVSKQMHSDYDWYSDLIKQNHLHLF
ncbi:Bug family tripartite tricarboxylate transporter substrate binding protein [Candidimonas nitroreducens]|uniref:ABC transporter substrate-binding protein n=1 Tax=Candidimonas nitroreducens TaxID=683354 RepID=A0A225MD05_9BURK|nr:tripartite tricarboxylate transporter substrate-binding protein [Candidimonas nitroreducens]OWT56849.1 hypothetical protein CEY11_18395 [Candidimonas nitroreducens]